eukprot:scaffold87012_cov20-Tisochrysis_lutea.AAC.2
MGQKQEGHRSCNGKEANRFYRPCGGTGANRQWIVQWDRSKEVMDHMVGQRHKLTMDSAMRQKHTSHFLFVQALRVLTFKSIMGCVCTASFANNTEHAVRQYATSAHMRCMLTGKHAISSNSQFTFTQGLKNVSPYTKTADCWTSIRRVAGSNLPTKPLTTTHTHTNTNTHAPHLYQPSCWPHPARSRACMRTVARCPHAPGTQHTPVPNKHMEVPHQVRASRSHQNQEQQARACQTKDQSYRSTRCNKELKLSKTCLSKYPTMPAIQAFQAPSIC